MDRILWEDTIDIMGTDRVITKETSWLEYLSSGTPNPCILHAHTIVIVIVIVICHSYCYCYHMDPFPPDGQSSCMPTGIKTDCDDNMWVELHFHKLLFKTQFLGISIILQFSESD